MPVSVARACQNSVAFAALRNTLLRCIMKEAGRLLATEFRMGRGASEQGPQFVKLRPSSPMASEWGIPSDVSGEILCRYRGSTGGAERLDVLFPQDRIIWGAPAAAFDFVDEDTGRASIARSE